MIFMGTGSPVPIFFTFSRGKALCCSAARNDILVTLNATNFPNMNNLKTYSYKCIFLP